MREKETLRGVSQTQRRFKIRCIIKPSVRCRSTSSWIHCKRWSMFTIFEEENEPLTERAKVDELLTKVQNSGLVAAVAQLRYQLNTTSGISSTVAANHLSSEISQTPDYQLSRKINATNINASGRGNGGCLPRTRRRPWTRRLWRKRNQQENDILFGGGVGKVIVRGTR